MVFDEINLEKIKAVFKLMEFLLMKDINLMNITITGYLNKNY